MTLFELAHHPEAFEHRHLGPRTWWGEYNNCTSEQFIMLNESFTEYNSVCEHTDENEFRMHLLFVHWATLKEE
jgi:hypothetical protein